VCALLIIILFPSWPLLDKSPFSCSFVRKHFLLVIQVAVQESSLSKSDVGSASMCHVYRRHFAPTWATFDRDHQSTARTQTHRHGDRQTRRHIDTRAGALRTENELKKLISDSKVSHLRPVTWLQPSSRRTAVHQSGLDSVFCRPAAMLSANECHVPTDANARYIRWANL